MYDLIEKKKRGRALTEAEIRGMVDGFVAGEIPDYQMSAMLMAIYFRGMDAQETVALTMAMAASGDTADLSGIEGIKVDKHSTGGVGDKTSLVIGPVAAALGVKVAKMSGRGLGHTGGTLDTLESIPGLSTSIDRERFFRIVNETGIAIIGQTGNMVPADKKLYALRDVTATVDSRPLIASSIMSKKLAAGSDAIVLDVKTGSGAFMKTLEDSVALAREMVEIGTGAGRKCCALITDMDVPLGRAIGNSLEVAEAVQTLRGEGPADLTGLSAAGVQYAFYGRKRKSRGMLGDGGAGHGGRQRGGGAGGHGEGAGRRSGLYLRYISLCSRAVRTEGMCSGGRNRCPHRYRGLRDRGRDAGRGTDKEGGCGRLQRGDPPA